MTWGKTNTYPGTLLEKSTTRKGPSARARFTSTGELVLLFAQGGQPLGLRAFPF